MQKEIQYATLLPQLGELLACETDPVANMANITAVLHDAFGFFWVGFYVVCGDTLILGPFQGSVACTRIAKGRGVCGTAWAQAETIIVPDVEQFPEHIACNVLSKSEIVTPVFARNDNNIIAVLDIDSDSLNAFDEIDKKYLEQIVKLLAW